MGPLRPLFWTYVLHKLKKKQECIPVGYVPSTAVAVSGGGEVSAQGDVCPGVVSTQGGVCPGVSVQAGFCLGGVYLGGGVCPGVCPGWWLGGSLNFLVNIPIKLSNLARINTNTNMKGF